MRRHRLGTTLAAASALALILLPAAPAAAATTVHHDTQGVVAENGATASVQIDGLRLTTLASPPASRVNFYDLVFPLEIRVAVEAWQQDPSNAQKAYEAQLALSQLTSGVLLSELDQLSYQTRKIDTDGGESILPALKIEIWCNLIIDYTTLVFEPYLQPGSGPGDLDYHEWQEWDADAGLFWSTKVVNGWGGQGSLKTLDEIVETCPAGVVLSVQVGQGSSPQSADALTDELSFTGLETDTTGSWPVPTPPDETVALTDLLTVVDSADIRTALGDKTEFERVHVWTVAPAGPGELPKTGTSLTWLIAVGSGLLLVGIAVVALVARRRAA